MFSHPSILLIDDSPGECELFRLAVIQSGLEVALFTEHDAEAAIHFLNNHSTLPCFVLLDWHLSNHCGDAFLKRLRSDSRFGAIPVVVFTTSDDATDLAAAYAQGANGYVVKPATFDELAQCIEDMCRYWIGRNRTAIRMTTTC